LLSSRQDGAQLVVLLFVLHRFETSFLAPGWRSACCSLVRSEPFRDFFPRARMALSLLFSCSFCAVSRLLSSRQDGAQLVVLLFVLNRFETSFLAPGWRSACCSLVRSAPFRDFFPR